MADLEIKKLQEFLEEERERRKAAERASQEDREKRQEAEKSQQEEREKRQEAERARETAEHATRQTTLPEFLDACHVHLDSNVVIQNDVSLSTRGDPSNARNKVRPEKIRSWEDFPVGQEAVWTAIVNTSFMTERRFSPTLLLQGNGESLRKQVIGSELDLHLVESRVVNEPVSLIVEHLYQHAELRKKFGLEGSVRFENHSNTLSPDEGIVDALVGMDITGRRRRSPRLLEREAQHDPDASNRSQPPAPRAKLGRPKADQFCVYNCPVDGSDTRLGIPVQIIEYKAPHKLKLGHIYEGLDDMDLEDVVTSKDTDGPKEECRRLVAAVICQAFSYMVSAGLEYGCIRTGQASIFLRVPEDPRTVYYFLSVPSGDVGESTGWLSGERGKNRLHLTTVGQMVAFTLQALRKTPRPATWRDRAFDELPTWQIVYEDLLEPLSARKSPPSEYRPPRHVAFLRSSPIRLRRRPRSSRACEPMLRGSLSDSDNPSDPETPSRPPQTSSSPRSPPTPKEGTPKEGNSSRRIDQRGGASNMYCSQDCLLGLVRRGQLDLACPNVQHHGGDQHRLSKDELLTALQHQLQRTMDDDFYPIGRPGSRGVPFAVRLALYGYTFVAKCVPDYFAHCLQHETAVYERLRPIQGIHVPVHLGLLKLPRPYHYEGIVDLTHVMLLSFGGYALRSRLSEDNCPTMLAQTEQCVKAVHHLGVRHNDVLSRNVLYDPSIARVLLVDFDLATMQHRRPALSEISANRKRKRSDEQIERAEHNKHICAPEMGQLAAELRDYLNSSRSRNCAR